MQRETPLVASQGWDDLLPLVKARLAARIAQSQVAVVMRIHRATLSAHECGGVTSSAQFVRRYGAALDHLRELKAKREAKAANSRQPAEQHSTK